MQRWRRVDSFSVPKLKYSFGRCMYSLSWRHEHFPQEVSHSMNESSGLMRAARLLLGRRNDLGARWLRIRLLLLEHPIGSRGQRPSNRHHCLGVVFAFLDPPIKLDHLPIRQMVLMKNDDAGSLPESPFPISIDIRMNFSIKGPSATRLNSGHYIGIDGQRGSNGKPLHLPNFHNDFHGQNQSHPGKSPHQLDGRALFSNLVPLLLYPVPNLQLDLHRPASLKRQRPLIPKCSRGNRNRRQGTIPQQKSQPLSIQFVRFIDLFHHQLCFARIGQGGTGPAFSIFSLIQNQFPTVSPVMEEP